MQNVIKNNANQARLFQVQHKQRNRQKGSAD